MTDWGAGFELIPYKDEMKERTGYTCSCSRLAEDVQLIVDRFDKLLVVCVDS